MSRSAQARLILTVSLIPGKPHNLLGVSKKTKNSAFCNFSALKEVILKGNISMAMSCTVVLKAHLTFIPSYQFDQQFEWPTTFKPQNITNKLWAQKNEFYEVYIKDKIS